MVWRGLDTTTSPIERLLSLCYIALLENDITTISRPWFIHKHNKNIQLNPNNWD